MASTIPFNISPAVLEWARISMGYTIEQAAQKMGVNNDKYEEWESGKKSPTYKQLENLSERVFKRSLAILLMAKPPIEDSIQKDFRNLSNAEIKNLSPAVRLCLRKAKRFQLILQEVLQFDNREEKYKEFKANIKEQPALVAKNFRNFLKLTLDEQKLWKYDDAFNSFKNKVESLGIYVFQMQMPLEEARAFCLTENIPIIVLSTDDSNNGKIFSLFHEVCHILLNINGVFRDCYSGELNREYAAIENFCNEFGASFLLPEEDFDKEINNYYKSEITNSNSISKLARLYNVSREVIARKLLLKKIIKEEDFWKNKKLWDSQAKSAKEAQKEKMKSQDTSGIAQDVKVIFEKGKPYVNNVMNAYQSGKISSSDLSSYLETKLNHIPKILERIKI